MSVVDFIFDTGADLVKVFTRVSEWFVTPIYYESNNPTRMPDWLVNWIGETFWDLSYVPEKIAVTPFSVIAGSGLVIVLGYMFAKWVLPIIK